MGRMYKQLRELPEKLGACLVFCVALRLEKEAG